MHKLRVLPDQEQLCMSRRQALATLAVGAVSTVSTVTACSSDSSKQQTPVTGGTADAGADTGVAATSCSPPVGTKQGTAASFAVGTWKLVGDVIVAQDTKGFFALTGICSHIGCNLDPPMADGTINCPCHGAQFDGNGNVLMGPAMRPLQHFALSICNGDVYVDTKTVVSADTRTPAA